MAVETVKSSAAAIAAIVRQLPVPCVELPLLPVLFDCSVGATGEVCAAVVPELLSSVVVVPDLAAGAGVVAAALGSAEGVTVVVIGSCEVLAVARMIVDVDATRLAGVVSRVGLPAVQM